MERKIKVLIGSEWVEGEEVEFKIKEENWNVYELKDGSILKFKAIITKVVRTNKYHPNTNDPIYYVHSTNAIDAIVPENLRKRE
ncbi:MAG: hypothetical protein AB1410_02630 [Acidobacteriota bacterium]